MKIVITTQVRENYGDANKPYWKFKGGDTYVVPDLSVEQTLKVKEYGIPTLRALIETRTQGFEEYVVDWSILDDDATVSEPWETPYNLYWEQGRWVARRIVENGEYGYMRAEVASKAEKYVMLMAGGRESYEAIYTMRNGDVVNDKDVNEYLCKAA
jgi:hypothetical protein